MRKSFLKYLQFEKRYSAHTISSYDNDLRQFESYLGEYYPSTLLEDTTHSIIRGWVVSLVDIGLDPKSVNRKITCLRSFYKFLLKREIISDDPTKKIQILKTAKKLPQFLNENEMSRLLDHITFGEGFSQQRDRLILELLYGTGTRLSEIIHLKHSDVDIANRTLKVLGKRNKERVIPFSVALQKIIETYIEEKNILGIQNDHNYLIVTEEGRQCYPMLIYRTVKKYLDLFTTIEKRSPHVLRHTFATHLLNKGAELNAVKDLLGHTSLAATQVYTHNSMEKLKAVFEQAHPKA
ncbi:tyrosine-type recombinase/integrase [Fulvivirga sp. M361]|uniref:tyrosine-type recombinase/integrase n=1 Tax=Fulvivirga sp. M361 TaxID=2594266 RepID=UPI00117A8617|nr:tyrosine-type recombinase/integrase [Fulvivirga sp. M361]TRX49356.1 tyrosine-type recombinase/integrase [Fulvivirga sp. M361]